MFQARTWTAAETLDEMFVKHYAAMVARAQLLVGRDRQAAEDLVHDTYVRVALRHRDTRAIQNVEGYLFTTLRNVHLSQVRRARLRSAQTISVVDYDSALAGLRSVHRDDDRQQASDALILVARYACLRKSTSKAAGVLILRFFHGYYPSEIARVLSTTESAVATRLRMVRAEARAFVANPTRLHAFAESQLPRRMDAKLQHDTELALALRVAIFDARTGVCFSSHDIDHIYAGEATGSLDVAALAHIVCCPACLDRVNRRLDLPMLADRDPADRLGRGSGGSGGAGGGRSDVTSVVRTRLQDACEDYPQELHVAVNGLIVGTQAIKGLSSEQRVKILLTEQVGFIEVFDEHDTCLLYLDVEPPPSGRVEQSATVALSDGRQLSATLVFSDVSPTVHVVYEQPVPSSVAQGAEQPAVTERPASVLEKVSPIRAWGFWPAPLRFVIAGLILGMLLANPSRTLAAAAYVGRAIVNSIAQLVERVRPRPVLPSRTLVGPADTRPAAVFAIGTTPAAPARRLPARTEGFSDDELSEVALEALRLLDGVAALTRDQVTVAPGADRRVHIEGLVDSEARRHELAGVLRELPVRALRLDLVTIDEASQRAASTTSLTGPTPLRSLELTENRVPAAYDSVRHYIVERGRTDQAAALELTADAAINRVVRRFSSDLLSRSLQTRLYARTVQELVSLVPPSRAERLSPSALATWRGLVERYTELVGRETASLRRDLESVFPPGEGDDRRDTVGPPEDAGTWQLAARLFELASAHNAAVRRAFAVATDGSESLDVGTATFRRSLLESETIADALRATMRDPSKR